KVLPVKLVKNRSFIVPQIGTLKKPSSKELRTYDTDHGMKLSLLTSIDYYRSYWNKMGVSEGVIVTAINGEEIYDVEDVERIMSERSAEDPLTIDLINKNGERERYSFRR
ncbi:MAG: serine protease, partial [Flavobacteriaceae bacterium]|nr:serine protease [Flavobacteriaceae bacterium]